MTYCKHGVPDDGLACCEVCKAAKEKRLEAAHAIARYAQEKEEAGRRAAVTTSAPQPFAVSPRPMTIAEVMRAAPEGTGVVLRVIAEQHAFTMRSVIAYIRQEADNTREYYLAERTAFQLIADNLEARAKEVP